MTTPELKKGCPFCRAQPQEGKTKTIEQPNSGEKYQNYFFRCPHKCAEIIRPTRNDALRVWNARAYENIEITDEMRKPIAEVIYSFVKMTEHTLAMLENLPPIDHPELLKQLKEMK